jgi:hypothetical protein
MERGRLPDGKCSPCNLAHRIEAVRDIPEHARGAASRLGAERVKRGALQAIGKRAVPVLPAHPLAPYPLAGRRVDVYPVTAAVHRVTVTMWGAVRVFQPSRLISAGTFA